MTKGQNPYHVRLATSDVDRLSYGALRRDAFRAGKDEDFDAFDESALHFMIERTCDLAVVGYFRLTIVEPNIDPQTLYSAQFFDLASLDGKTAELGRFCLLADAHDPDIIRMAWGHIARIIQTESVETLIGCVSFQGDDATTHLQALAELDPAKFLTPKEVLTPCNALDIDASLSKVDPLVSPSSPHIPSLLRSYLAFGAKISPFMVRDPDLGTFLTLAVLRVRDVAPLQKEMLLSLGSD